jgi:YVTN family beta-propeller protein
MDSASLESILWNECKQRATGGREVVPVLNSASGGSIDSSGVLWMRNKKLISRAAISLGIMMALGVVMLGPWSTSQGGDAPSPKVGPTPSARSSGSHDESYPSPIALAVSADGTRLLVANQGTGTVALLDPKSARLLHEIKTGDKPAGVALSRDGRRGVVTHWFGYDLAVLEIKNDKLAVVDRIEVGPEPRGVAIAADGATAFVAVGVSNELVRVDLNTRKITGRLTVGREPRGIALSPDGTRLLVGNARAQSVSVIDAAAWSVLKTIPIDGDNLRQVTISADGKTGYIANMRNRMSPTTKNNIDLGWVLGQRLTRVPLDGTVSYDTVSLDTQGKAVSDAHGVAVSRDMKYVAISCGGTHEVIIFRTDLKPLPWRPNSSRDLIAPELLKKDGRFRRVPLGGRPTELAFAPGGSMLYVANYLADTIQVVDAESAKLVGTIALGGPKTVSLARQGEIVFHDAVYSHNQWYSCNTCHSDGHTNGLDFDTLNDGRQDNSALHKRSRKKVPTLRRVTKTEPWTWHGWQTNLDDSMVESFTKSMQGRKPKPEDVKALVAFLDTLDYPRNPYRAPDGSLTPAAKRGQGVFRSAKAGCNSCHGGPEFTDGRIHEAGLEERDDAYRGYNPPSLRGVYDKDPYLHDGRSKTLREALSGPHSAENGIGLDQLSAQELDDLIAYLKSL